MSKVILRADVAFEFGTAFALLLSWTTWHSFWWAILHSLFGWLYVLWFFIIQNYDVLIP